MKFFEQQESARRCARRFAVLFALSAVPCLFFFTVLTVLLFGWVAGYTPFEFMEDLYRGRSVAAPMLVGGLATLVLAGALIVIKSEHYKDGAHYLQFKLDATPIPSNTKDPALRQARNVCEEMALAAGIPAPRLYDWNTPALNAFPVGHNVADASVFVSRGALQSLSRDEMQALLAHSVAQIANGDMALNGRLATFLYIYHVTPRVAIYLAGFPIFILMPLGPKVAQVLGAIFMLPWVFTGMFPCMLLAILSTPPYLFACFVKWLLLRQRKVLADATVLQLTRNPPALRDLFVKAMAIGTRPAQVPGALAHLSHACFARLGAEWGLSAIAPLEKRIRALDPNFHLYRSNEIDRMRGRAGRVRRRWQEPEPRAKEVPPVKQRAFFESVAKTAFLGATLSRVPTRPAPETRASIASPDDARAVLLALLVDRKPGTQERQFEALRGMSCEQSIASVLTALQSLQPMQHTERTLELDRHLPALRELSPADLRWLQQAIAEIQRLDNAIDVFEYAVARVASVFIADILSPRVPHGTATIVERLGDIHVLFCVMAQYTPRGNAPGAYEAGMRSLDPARRFQFAALEHWARRLDASLGRLDSLLPLHKELLLDAGASILKFDREETPAERELMRAIAASLHCPVPRLQRAAPAVRTP